MHSSAFVLLVLLSSALSKSATNREIHVSTATKVSSPTPIESKHNSTNYKGSPEIYNDSAPIETLFIPEDLNRYEEILHHVHELFQAVEESINPLVQEIQQNSTENVADNMTDGDQFSNSFLDIQERNPSPSDGERDEEQHLQRNPAGIFPKTTVEDDKKDEVVPIEWNNSEGKREPDEEDLFEAANFGLEAMKELYNVKEPMLYSMGLYLDSDNPARHVAVFNDQTDEARALAKYGFAVLQGTTLFRRKFPDAPTDSFPSRRSQSNPLQRSCPNRGVPDCPPASFRYRTSDGSCNNLQHLWWGSSMSAMQRFLPPVYDDGIQRIRKSVTGEPLPNARQVTVVIHEDKDIPLASVTHMLMQWGQFVDHDLTATGQSRGFNGSILQCCLKSGAGFQPPEFMHPECLPISVSAEDNFFGSLGVRCLEFVRSGSAPKEDCKFGPREQLTQVTSYLDASTVYGSNAFQSDTLRLFRNGLLQYGRLQSQRPVLPKLDADLCKLGSLSTSCFRAGDGRLGEQPALTSLHVAFLRLHNRISTKLAGLNAHWSDEKLFQESRRIVAAIVQHITYREFLPIVLGPDVLKIFNLELLKKGHYEGYDSTVNPTIANAFSTAAYRFGHSLVQHSFVRFDSNHRPIFNNVSIHNEFLNPENLETAGSVDRILLGLINQPAQRRDEHISEELTNHLFQTPSFPFGMDLASINIQRGRDHGIPPYVKWREPCGLSLVRNFDDLENVMPPSTARKFKFVYSSVEDIDLFTAGLAEKSVKGGLVGPTFACIIGQQFSNLRRGDRFWYENSEQENTFTPGQLQQIRRITLAQVLCTTMDSIETVQPFVFLTQDNLKNQRIPCSEPIIGQLNLEFWAERSPQFRRAGFLDLVKKKSTVTSTTASTVKSASVKQSPLTTEIPMQQRFIIPQSPKPPKASINQSNKIVVKKPLGPPDNFTIVVQNNAINSPVFVSDAIYGSSIRINPSMNQNSNQGPISQEPLPVPAYFPPVRPIPTTHPLANYHYNHPYVPYAFNDPSNPNPLSQGFQAYMFSDVIFESFPGTSPRPTLYTYYTNFQRQTTKRPTQNLDVFAKPQDYGSKPNSWSDYQSQSSFKPPHASSDYNSGSQENNNQGYGTNTWQKVQYSQGNKRKPYDSAKEQQSISKDSDNRYESIGKYTTWSSVSSDKKTQDKVNDQQPHLNGPSYQTQLNRHPIQPDLSKWSTASSYQKGSTKPSTDYNQGYQNDFANRPTVTTVKPSSYLNSARPGIDHSQSYQKNDFSNIPIAGTVNPGSVYLNSAKPNTDYSQSYQKNDFSIKPTESTTNPNGIYLTSARPNIDESQRYQKNDYSSRPTESTVNPNGVYINFARPNIDHSESYQNDLSNKPTESTINPNGVYLNSARPNIDHSLGYQNNFSNKPTESIINLSSARPNIGHSQSYQNNFSNKPTESTVNLNEIYSSSARPNIGHSQSYQNNFSHKPTVSTINPNGVYLSSARPNIDHSLGYQNNFSNKPTESSINLSSARPNIDHSQSYQNNFSNKPTESTINLSSARPHIGQSQSYQNNFSNKPTVSTINPNGVYLSSARPNIDHSLGYQNNFSNKPTESSINLSSARPNIDHSQSYQNNFSNKPTESTINLSSARPNIGHSQSYQNNFSNKPTVSTVNLNEINLSSARPNIDYSQAYQNDFSNKPTESTINANGVYLSSARPDIDHSQAYQNDFPNKPTESTVNPSNIYLSSAGPVLNDNYNKKPSDSYVIVSHSTHKPLQAIYQADKSPETSYQTFTRPKPAKIHSVTIVTESAEMSHAGDEIDNVKNRVTSEIPKPLISPTGNNRVMKPGQYYYEKNVLHRYPDKIEDGKGKPDAEQRHKASVDEESIDRSLIEASVKKQPVIGGNGDNTSVCDSPDTMNQTKSESSDSTSDKVQQGPDDEAFSEEIEDVASSNRTSHWVNPQEDSSLPSALEVPKIPSDKATVAKELPKPIKLRNYAS